MIKTPKKVPAEEENIVYFMGPYTDTVSDIFEQFSNLIIVHDLLGGLYMVDLEKGETTDGRTVILDRYKGD